MIEKLDEANDFTIWEFAKSENFAIVTKDNDFLDISTLYGFPPKVIYIKTGNCKVKVLEELLKANKEAIVDFLKDKSCGILEIDTI